MNKVLLVDDEEKLRSLLASIIRLEGFEVLEAKDCKTALKRIEQEEPDLVLCDVKLPDGNGIELLKKIKAHHSALEVIMLTAYGNIPDGVQAIKNGAFDYITKGDDTIKIIPLIHKALEKTGLARRVQHLEQQLGQRYSFDSIIGHSRAIRQAIELGQKVAPTDTTVLLFGETGTGKEVFARAIHYASPRSGQLFLAVNCAAFSKELLESEMFGYAAGAFTGAAKDKKGLFEEAHRGTLLLDEIGEMSLDLQAKLLRVLESGEVLRVGTNKPIKVDVRILAATNRSLEKEIAQGRFREDLYYRISVFQITLPPLRERVSDIPELVQHFLAGFVAKTNKKIYGFTPSCIEALQRHPWHGNIRELRNIVERAVILCDAAEITPGCLPDDFQFSETTPAHGLPAFHLSSAEKLHIQKVLNYTEGNKTRAAELLGIALTTLYRKLHEYNIR